MCQSVGTHVTDLLWTGAAVVARQGLKYNRFQKRNNADFIGTNKYKK